MKTTTLFRIFFLISTLQLAACAIAVPVHEGEIAETLGEDIVKIQGGYVVAPAIYVQPRATNTGENKETEDFLFLSAKYGITNTFDGEISYLTGDSFSGYRFGIKYMWLGDKNLVLKGDSLTNLNNFSSSIAARLTLLDGSNTDVTFGDTTYYFDNISGEIVEVSNSFGYRVSNNMSLYAGPKLSYLDVRSKYGENPNNRKEFTAQRHFAAYTLFTGIGFFNATNKGTDVNLELYTTNMEGSLTDKRVWYYGFLMSLGFIIDRSPEPVSPQIIPSSQENNTEVEESSLPKKVKK